MSSWTMCENQQSFGGAENIFSGVSRLTSHLTSFRVHSTGQQFSPSPTAMTVVPIPSSVQLTRHREGALASVKDDCDEKLRPENGNMTFFYPTKDCGIAINHIRDDYPQQAASSPELYAGKPQKISDYRHAGFVYFPGDTVIESFTILVPLRVSGQVKIGEVFVDGEHYYHVLSGAVLSVMADSRLEAIAISKIL